MRLPNTWRSWAIALTLVTATVLSSCQKNNTYGRRTANGELYNVQSLTAAHRTLPLPSWVKITNLRNNKSVIARVNDRGPFAKSRIIDVSQKVAEKLSFKNQGTTEVRVELLSKQTKNILQKLNINKNE